MEHELWRPVVVPGDDENRFGPLYDVSHLGRVRNAETKRILNGGVQTKGYTQVTLSFFGETALMLLHVLVAEAWLPRTDPNRKQLNHKDGDKSNNRVDNLEWVTGSENMKHAYATGLMVPRGGRRKLSDEQVAEIRSRKYQRGSYIAWGKEFGVSWLTIRYAYEGTTYKHI